MALIIKDFKGNNPASAALIDQWIRVKQPAATNPATTSRAIFSVNGKCLVKALFGSVTTLQQTQTNNTSITFTPSGGANADLASNLDTTAKAVGTTLWAEGDGTALIAVANVHFAPIPALCSQFFMIEDGTLYWKTGATSTGAVEWYIYYQPLDPGASIVAA